MSKRRRTGGRHSSMKSPRHARKTPSSRASGGINSQGTRLATGLIGRRSLEKRCPSDGDRGFESLSLQRRVSCEPDFRGRIPSMIVGVPTSGASFLTGDRGFESGSLHQRVRCEPDSLDQGADISLISTATSPSAGGAFRIISVSHRPASASQPAALSDRR